MLAPTTRPLHRATALVAAALAVACSTESPRGDSVERQPARDDTTATFQGRTFERNVVFLTTRDDSTIVVPWLMGARTRPGGVDRRARGFLGRGDTFEAFFDAAWESPPTRVPWRILPRGSMRLIVGNEERLERIAFEEGGRQLHVVLEDELVEWSGQRGEVFRLTDGALMLSSQRVPGLVLDMSRARRADDVPPGDWAVVTSGDSLEAVLHSPVARPPGSPGTWRAWVRGSGGEEEQWPAVTMTWEATRAFERARRDVPVIWSLDSGEDGLSGRLEATASWIQEGSGEGPQLPVDALLMLEGTLRLREVEYPVQGLLRHEQR
ncbi:MAG: hypothetical protein PVI57_05100 [Gemmatimonadota bacterium]|jgi:hypothetical protein